MEYQLRNWLYYTWLRRPLRRAAHPQLDKMAWAMHDEPVKAFALAPASRTQEVYGHIFDHHAVVFEYKNGVKALAVPPARKHDNEIKDFLFGAKGVAT